MRRLRGAHVGAHRDVHADVTGHTGTDCANGEADGRQRAQGEENHHADDHADDGDGGVLPVQVGTGTFLDGGGDFLHPGIAGILGQYPFNRLDTVNERADGTD